MPQIDGCLDLLARIALAGLVSAGAVVVLGIDTVGRGARGVSFRIAAVDALVRAGVVTNAVEQDERPEPQRALTRRRHVEVVGAVLRLDAGDTRVDEHRQRLGVGHDVAAVVEDERLVGDVAVAVRAVVLRRRRLAGARCCEQTGDDARVRVADSTGVEHDKLARTRRDGAAGERRRQRVVAGV